MSNEPQEPTPAVNPLGTTMRIDLSPEAIEEANCKVTDLVEMTRFLLSPGMSNEVLILYCGRMDSSQAAGIHGLATEHEDIRSTLFDAKEIPALIEHGTTGNGPLTLALYWMQANRERLRKAWS